MSRVILIGCVAVLMFGGCQPTLEDVKGEGAFRDVTNSQFSPEPRIAGWPGIALFDYDNDGDIDIFITNVTGIPNHLYDNDGSGSFTDVANLAGVRFSTDSGVATAVGDFDNDGWLDLIIGRQIDMGGMPGDESIRYLKNLGPNDEGQVRFADATAESGLAGVDFAASIGVGDVDNDGWLDVYIGRYDFRELSFRFGSYLPDTPNVLLRNTGSTDGVPKFVDITDQAGVAGTRISGLAPESANMLNRVPTWAVYMTDVNEDGRLDIFSLQEVPGGVDLFINNGDLTFQSTQADLLNKRGGWMGISAADFDRDGHLDYFLSNVGADAVGDSISSHLVTGAWRYPDGSPFHRLLSRDSQGNLVDVAMDINVSPGSLPPTNILGGRGMAAYEFAFGVAWLDVENNGWPDITWTGDITLFDDLGEGLLRLDFHGVARMLINNGDQSFADQTGVLGLFNWSATEPLAFGLSRSGRALGAIDLNGDGLQDLCRTNLSGDPIGGAGFECFINASSKAGHWLTIRLIGTTSNSFGIGARIEARTGSELFVGEVVSTTSAFTAIHPQVHFGLGEVDSLESLTVRWPAGTITTLNDVSVDRVLTITE